MTSIKDLIDNQLKLKKTAMEAAMIERQKAASHNKFNDPNKKLSFPPHGSAFMQLYDQILLEIKNRGIVQ